MVKLYLSALLMLLAASAHAITADELRQITEEGAQDQRDRDARFKVDKLETRQAAPEKKTSAPRSTKYSGSASGATATKANSPATRVKDSPTLPATASGFVVDAAKIDEARQFGVRMGSWIKARVNRNTTSADPGSVELSVSEEVAGDRRSLPAGTLLFAEKTFNAGTNRMDLYIVRGITPDGVEFRAKGIVYDQSKVAGLPGIITTDAKQVVKTGATKGMLAASRALVDKMSGGTPVGSAVGAGAGSLLSDTENVASERNRQSVTISVAPQPIYVQVEETF